MINVLAMPLISKSSAFFQFIIDTLKRFTMLKFWGNKKELEDTLRGLNPQVCLLKFTLQLFTLCIREFTVVEIFSIKLIYSGP